jgi:hypothetical protein
MLCHALWAPAGAKISMMKSVLTFSVMSFALASAAAGKDSAPAPRAAALQRVIDCRSIADSTQRLACYDTGVAAMEAAENKKDIVVVDREQVHKARTSLFGFALPSLDIFDGHRADSTKDDKDADDIQEVTSTVKSARQDRDGMWVVTLEDGAIWHQTEGVVALGPRPGNTIIIKRGALGSYVMRIGKQPGVKARREG